MVSCQATMLSPPLPPSVNLSMEPIMLNKIRRIMQHLRRTVRTALSRNRFKARTRGRDVWRHRFAIAAFGLVLGATAVVSLHPPVHAVRVSSAKG